ncbi:MAG: DUF1761 domain-containing protein [Patescibacteria group bacterium]
MDDVAINYLALFVAALVAVGIGTLWYSPIGFGKQWMAASGVSPEKMEKRRKHMPVAVIGGFLSQLITAYVLVHLASLFDVVSVAEALALAFWAWLGFTAATSLHAVLWEGKPALYWAINAGYQLAALGAMSLILSLWH